jgi:hypothetical protein
VNPVLAYLLAHAIITPPLLVLAVLANVRRNERVVVEISRTIVVATTKDRK